MPEMHSNLHTKVTSHDVSPLYLVGLENENSCCFSRQRIIRFHLKSQKDLERTFYIGLLIIIALAQWCKLEQMGLGHPSKLGHPNGRSPRPMSWSDRWVM